ncbi:MAG: SH3 domain-containing protein [Treponema sp.]|uniref:SH3 domain-containing protein n=1 Tax=Treponema sp. TaxID=166 RepID=UPI001B76BD8A|nr:SH3 domain-containing protein [Treponema sp.]MBP5402937.1 SH3 domain-containing protein [Treponema sp.]MBR5932798.1 SH3 domain-containing protein [Treponema sp.]
MKSIYKRVLVLLFLGAIFTPVFAAGNKNQYVSVTSAAVKAKASQFSASVGTLKYGDVVTVIKVEKGWSNITSSDGKITGWLPNASLTAKKLVVEVESKKKTSANAKELALAGKGFDKNFEKDFAAQNNVSFSQVDKVETFSANEKETIAFIKEGNLNAGEE